MERKEKTVRVGSLKKDLSSLTTVLLLVYVCFFSQSVNSQKRGGLFLEISGPGLIWGEDRAALNVIPFDSSACTRTTHIKSAC